MPKRELFFVNQNNWLFRFPLPVINLHQKEPLKVSRIQARPPGYFAAQLSVLQQPRGLLLLVFIKALVTE